MVLKATPCRIDLVTGAKPIQEKPHRAGTKAGEVEIQDVERMLKKGIIEPAYTEWASPLLLVKKKLDNRMSFCVDYWNVNALTDRYSYPILRMDECIDYLGDTNVFITLDANFGYWQVEIPEEDTNNITFTCHAGIFRFISVPFCL